MLALGELEELAPDREPLVELASVQVEARQAPQQRQRLRRRTGLLELGERARVDLLDLRGVAADRHEPAGEARAQA